MTLAKLFLATVAASAATVSAEAANVVINTQSEESEYLRVCDAFGQGYFFIPGTETCLKLEGYSRFQVNAGPNAGGSKDYDPFVRVHVQLTANSDTEHGPLTSVLTLRALGGRYPQTNSPRVEAAYIDIAGFRAGVFYGWWDYNLTGDTDDLFSPYSPLNSVRYQYEASGLYAGIAADRLDAYAIDRDAVGVALGTGGRGDGFRYHITGGYDTDFQEWALRALGKVEIGVGTLGFSAVYSSNPNGYYATAGWSTAAEYSIAATEKLLITPAIQYFGNYGANVAKSEFRPNDAWKTGVTVDYQIMDNFFAKLSLEHTEINNADNITSGFIRFERAF
jgi:hypothetical protein